MRVLRRCNQPIDGFLDLALGEEGGGGGVPKMQVGGERGVHSAAEQATALSGGTVASGNRVGGKGTKSPGNVESVYETT